MGWEGTEGEASSAKFNPFLDFVDLGICGSVGASVLASIGLRPLVPALVAIDTS